MEDIRSIVATEMRPFELPVGFAASVFILETVVLVTTMILRGGSSTCRSWNFLPSDHQVKIVFVIQHNEAVQHYFRLKIFKCWN